VTPEEIDTVTDGVIKVHAMADRFGPGLLLAAAIAGAWWACRRIAAAVHDRLAVAAARRQLRRRQQRIARIPTTFRGDTHPGHDQQLLADCWAAWNANTREEKP
jgi:hypothetical protein